jgi:hypothetical protein
MALNDTEIAHIYLNGQDPFALSTERLTEISAEVNKALGNTQTRLFAEEDPKAG